MAGPVTAIAKALEYKGMDSGNVFRAAGIRQAIRNDPTDRLSVSATAALFRHCVEATRDPYFGLTVAKFIRVSNIHALGYPLLASKTLLDFCLRLERYFALVTQSAKLHVERGAHEIADFQAALSRLGCAIDRISDGLKLGLSSQNECDSGRRELVSREFGQKRVSYAVLHL